LDNQEFSRGQHFDVTANYFAGNSFNFGDEPFITCTGSGTIMHDEFMCYVRFKPTAGSDSIYVTLGLLKWHDYCQTTLAIDPSNGLQDYTPFSPPTRGPANPGEAQWDTGLIDSVDFPVWQYVIKNQGR